MSDGAASNVANDSQEKHEDTGRPIDVVIASAEAPPSPPPDGGYGWICVLACFCVNAFTWGVVAVSPPSQFSFPHHKAKSINGPYTRMTD